MCQMDEQDQGLYSAGGKTSQRKISWSLEAAISGVIMTVSLWNLTDASEAHGFETSRDLAVRIEAHIILPQLNKVQNSDVYMPWTYS